MTLTVDLQSQGQVEFCMNFFILGWRIYELLHFWLKNVYDLEFQGQTLKIRKLFQHFRHPRPQNCWNRYTDNVCMMFTTGDTKGHTQMCLTFIFKVNHQGQMTNFRFFEILNLAYVRIDTKIKSVASIHKSVASIQPEIGKVIQLTCVTLSSKVNRPSHMIFLTYLISLTSKMLESTPRLTSYYVYNRRWERSCKKVFDLDFQGHAMKIEFFHYHRWIPWPRKHTHEKYFKKFGREKAEIQGGLYQPPLGHLRVKLTFPISDIIFQNTN